MSGLSFCIQNLIGRCITVMRLVVISKQWLAIIMWRAELPRLVMFPTSLVRSQWHKWWLKYANYVSMSNGCFICLSRRRRNNGEDGSKTANDFLRNSKHEGGRKEVSYVGRSFFINFRAGKPVAVYILTQGECTLELETSHRPGWHRKLGPCR